MKKFFLLPTLLSTVLILACAGRHDDPTTEDAQLRASLEKAGVRALQTPVQDPQKVALGKALMFDKILSGNKDISCATCHHPLAHTGDALSVSIGVGGTGLGMNRVIGPNRNFIPRNAPEVFNRGVANFDTFFWDGRVSGTVQNGFTTPAGTKLLPGLDNALAAQAMFPVTSRDEMRGAAGDIQAGGAPNELAMLADNDFSGIWNGLMARLMAIPEYARLFGAAFPTVPHGQLGFQHAANAIGAFEASLWALADSPFDHYVAGDSTSLSAAQKRGAALFYGKARCSECHSGPSMTDLKFHNIAAPQIGPGKGAESPLDYGRGRETGQTADRFKFRTPPLRNVALTGPWTHAGAYTTLEGVIRHHLDPRQSLQAYNASQLAPRFAAQVHNQNIIQAGVFDTLDGIVTTPLALSNAEVADLVSFLQALTDPKAMDQSIEVPFSVPSGLPVSD
ncbi:MAG: cytochrome-c peroxidase [Holophagaceae bacterium]|nr:cytochrome-c peroxidase [Holophagaceae bacterium]